MEKAETTPQGQETGKTNTAKKLVDVRKGNPRERRRKTNTTAPEKTKTELRE